MYRLPSRLARVLFVCASLTLLAAPAPAFTSDPKVKVELTGTVMRSGKPVAIADAGRVYPGELVTWSLKLTNHGPGAARSLRVRGFIPSGTVFVPGSASGDSSTAVLYSADGGRVFSEHPTVWVVESDGRRRERPAPVESYTDLQFTFAALGAREVKEARYQTRVR